jgi:hypothetical protein
MAEKNANSHQQTLTCVGIGLALLLLIHMAFPVWPRLLVRLIFWDHGTEEPGFVRNAVHQLEKPTDRLAKHWRTYNQLIDHEEALVYYGQTTHQRYYVY